MRSLMRSAVSMNFHTRVTLRTVKDADSDFCFLVKKAALSQYVAGIWGWDEEFQLHFHQTEWGMKRGRRPQVVCLDARDVGIIEIATEADHYHLRDFYLLPEFQRQGIGSHLLQKLIADSKRTGRFILLEVLKNNPAKQLYLRNGFAQTGETNSHFVMEREPM